MKNSIRVSLLTVPALVVTAASLFILLVAVAGAARDSKPGDLLYSLRAPASQVQFILNNDNAPQSAPAQPSSVAPIVAPQTKADEGIRLSTKQDADTKTTLPPQISTGKDHGQKIIGIQPPQPVSGRENETETRDGNDDKSSSDKSSGSDNSGSGNNKGSDDSSKSGSDGDD